MKSLMQLALGADWHKLPASLKAHYQAGSNVDIGYLDIEFPRYMRPYLWLLHGFGALLPRSGKGLSTRVEKDEVSGRQNWRRTVTFPDGKIFLFNSYWTPSKGNQVIEFVNAVMGLEMAARVAGNELHYDGVRYVLKLGRLMIGLPEWLILGHTTIVERELSEGTFSMDFRLTHPLFGMIFRYSGVFCTQRLPS